MKLTKLVSLTNINLQLLKNGWWPLFTAHPPTFPTEVGFGRMDRTKANAADCPSCVFIEGVLPVMVSQIGANCAGEVHFIAGVFWVGPCRMASVTRAAADWQALNFSLFLNVCGERTQS